MALFLFVVMHVCARTTLAPAIAGRGRSRAQLQDTATCTVPAPPRGTAYAAAPCAQGAQVNAKTNCVAQRWRKHLCHTLEPKNLLSYFTG